MNNDGWESYGGKESGERVLIICTKYAAEKVRMKEKVREAGREWTSKKEYFYICLDASQ